MIGWLLDTNVISELNKRGCARPVEQWFVTQPDERLFLSLLSFGELDKGVYLLDPGDRRRAGLAGLRDALEARFGERVLPVSRGVVRRWGEVTARVKKETGHPPPVIDTFLAATAIEHDLYLVTRNTKDVKLSGAALFNPWEDEPADFPLASA